MESTVAWSELHTVIGKMIDCKVRWMIGRCGLKRQDREDLRGELWQRILPRLKKYNEAKSKPNTFASRLVHREAARILMLRKRKKCDYRREELSVNETVKNAELGTLSRSETIAQSDRDRGFCRGTAPAELVELQVDLQLVMEKLPQELRALCECLRIHSPIDTQKILKLNRYVFTKQIGELRRILTSYGFQNYFQKG